MGLDFVQSDARWSYSGFNRFRTRLAVAAGRTLESYRSLSGRTSFPPSPIDPLMNHSDCDGEISPEDCAQVAPALLAIVGQWPPDDYDRENATILAHDMERCAQQGVALEFT